MGFGGTYGVSDDAESIRTIEHAIANGVTYLDTGDFYGMGQSELVVGRAIKGKRDSVVLSVKFGSLRGPDGAWLGFDARPMAVKNACAYSLKRLGVDAIDIYRPSRLDPQVPIEETIGAIAELVKAGYVKHIALSEVGADTIRRAAKVAPIVDLQIEYSLVSRKPETTVFPVLRELGISATLYGVYSRGLLTGSKPTGKGDFRAFLPRFAGPNAEKNAAPIDAIAAFAKSKNLTAAELLLAYVRAKQPGFLPVVGVKNSAQLDSALRALKASLSAGDVAELERLVPPDAIAGTRYGEQQMRVLDSEK
jgi:aryl-alcohol dehydrogenase-like predicted oxidoreductase